MVKDKESALMELEQWRLGRTSERYESGGRGPGVISTGRGDHGGVSYGTYQLSTKTGTLREYLSQSKYAHRFAGLQPSTPEFDAVWRELARTDPGFAQDQHDFIGRTHYERQRQRLKATGIDLDGRGRSVHDALWSTAVQFRNLTPTIFRKGIEERFGQGRDLSSLSDRDIVEAVQDYKIAHNERLFRSSPSWWPGLLKRAHAEKVDLLRLATLEEIAGMRNAEALNSALVEPSFSGRPLRQGDRGQVVRRLQESLNEIGVTSAAGNPLREDGHFGPRTREAVEAFQRAQGLRVDGVVGRETLAALRAAESRLAQAAPPAAQTPGAADFRDPAHAAFRQTLAQVQAMESRHGVAHGAHSERLAAALLVELERARAGTATRVELDGEGRAHAVLPRFYAGEAERRVSVEVSRALAVPVEDSAVQWRQLRAPPLPEPPAAPRSAEQARLLEALPEETRALFATLRARFPPQVPDAQVARAMRAAEQGGIVRADQVAGVVVRGHEAFVVGRTPGVRVAMDLAAPAPSREQGLAPGGGEERGAMQRVQDPVHGHGLRHGALLRRPD